MAASEGRISYDARTLPDPPGRSLCLMRFGSHLYGTDTPESDLDYKGVFMPAPRDVLMGRIQKSVNHGPDKGADAKNEAGDVEAEWYSLHYFVQLALEGQTVALDMLHAPFRAHERWSDAWLWLRRNRGLFHTRNLKAFVGYARRQAAKYGIKGSRLADARRVLEILRSVPEGYTAADGSMVQMGGDPRVEDVWHLFPELEHARFLDREDGRFYQVCGRLLTPRERASYAAQTVGKFVDAYGERARQAAANEGIDWKAIGHAYRAAYVVRHILRGNDFEYPLPDEETRRLREVKAGDLDYRTDAAPGLERLMDEVEQLAEQSDLPRKPPRKAIERWLADVTRDSVCGTTAATRAQRGGVRR